MQETQIGVSPVATQTLGEGAVNFNANVLSQTEEHSIQVAEATSTDESSALGNTRELGTIPRVTLPAMNVTPPSIIHTVRPAIYVTINTGLTFLKGMRELKSVDIETNAGSFKFNFYNPFMRADKDRQTGEGLLRKTLGSIAKIAQSVLGREVVYVGSNPEELERSITNLANSVRTKLSSQFPCSPTDPVFNANIVLDDGSTITRPVEFQELFAINSWVTSDTDDETLVTTHVVSFNIAMNIGAVYDSAEPHAFVRKTVSFLDSQLAALGFDSILEHRVCYAFDSASLGEVAVRDSLEVLWSEDGFITVSKAGVKNGKYPWITSGAADSLFGYGCDLIVMSPAADISDDSAAE